MFRSAIAKAQGSGQLTAQEVGARFAPGVSVGGGAPTVGEAVFAPGRVRVGPLEIGIALDGQGDHARVDLSVQNVSEAPVQVESVFLGLRWRDHGLKDLRFLKHGWQSWSETCAEALDEAGPEPFPSGEWLRSMFHARGAPPADRGGWHESHLLAAVGASDEGPACCVGVLERGGEFGVVHLRPGPEEVRLAVELVLETELAPGERRGLEPVRAAVGTDVNRLLQEHADAHGAFGAARSDAPFQAGWCSWYHFFHDVTEEDLLRNLDALAAARNEVPISVVQLDDGFQREIGDWLETNAKFPRGLAPVAEGIRSAGFLPGLWTAPFNAVPKSRVFEDHPEWFLRDEAGAFFRGLVHPTWNPEDGAVHVLDTTRAEVVAHLEKTFREIHDLGFVYHKIDFLFSAAMPSVAADMQVTRAERLRAGLEAVRRGVGERDFILGCGCPLGPAVGVVDGMRIGPDVAPRWGNDAPIKIPGIEPTQPSTRSAVRNVLARAFQHRRLWLNDPDCLMARTSDTNLTPNEAATLGASIAGSAGMLIFSDDWQHLGDEGRALLLDTLDGARAVDRIGGGRAVRTLGVFEPGFAKGTSASDGTRTIRAHVNGSDETAECAGVTLPGRSAQVVREGPPPPCAVFCDFDGTFLVQDVGSTLAKQYAADRRPAAWERYERGETTAWEYNLEILHGLPCPPEALEEFLMSVELDPGASDLVDWCADRGVPFRVLSDGFDRNLDRLQERFGVRFEYECNRLWYEGDRWGIAAGFPNPACGCGTGTCKRGRIEQFRRRNPGVPVAHIGNGRVSDLCGARAADWAFAKDTLAPELDRQGVPYEPFDTLADVIAALTRRISG